jgi:hypothetical protein
VAKAPKPPAPPPPPPPPPRWDSDPTCYITGRSHIDKATYLGAQAETHWGCGRLRLLVSDELRIKFDSQRFKLQQAIEHGELQDVIHEANRMALAWMVLDKTARAAGHPPLSLTVWETRLDDGSVAAIVPDDSVAKGVVANDRAMAVFTLSEIGKLLSHYQGVVQAKLVFPGATVEHVSRSVPDPLDRKIEEDAMPF